MRILYFDCISGISGDMTVGALVDLGVDKNKLELELQKLQLNEAYELLWEKVVKKGISSTKMTVILKKEELHLPQNETLSHPLENKGNTGTASHTEEKGPSVEHSHLEPSRIVDHTHDKEPQSAKKQGHDHGSHSHHHRHYKDIVKLIRQSGFNERITHFALAVFEKIAQSEGKIHNMPIERVHFHEVGAIDSIVDIVATAIAIDEIDPDQIIASPVPVGSGSIQIDHGRYPVPAPATLDLLKGIPLKATDLTFELTTPTGAGILSALVDTYGLIPSMTVTHIGYGAGTKDFPGQPNVLRVIVGETEAI